MSDLSLTIDGKRWGSWWQVSLRRSIDSVAEVSFTAPFEHEREDFRETFRPFSYKDVTVDIDGQTMFVGTMVGIDPSSSPDSSTVSVSCYGKPGVLECTMPSASYPLEFNGLSLQQIADSVCGAFGISARFDIDESAQSERDAYRSYLQRVRRQRGVIADLRAKERVEEMVRKRELQQKYKVGQYSDYRAGRTGGGDVMGAQIEAAKSQKYSKDVERIRDLERQRQRYDLIVPSTGGGAEGKAAVIATFDAQIAAARAKILSIPGPPLSLDTPFRRVAMKSDEAAFSFLTKLAKQRNFVITDSTLGELLFWRSVSPGDPRARFAEGSPPLLSVSASFDPQSYYSEITGLANTRSGRRGGAFTVSNTFANGFVRPSAFSPGDTDSPDLERAVQARMGRMFAAAASFDVEVPTWRDAFGELWRPNTTVTLTAPSAMVYRETELLIRDVTFNVDSDQAETAQISLVLPGAFSGEIPEALPWA